MIHYDIFPNISILSLPWSKEAWRFSTIRFRLDLSSYTSFSKTSYLKRWKAYWGKSWKNANLDLYRYMSNLTNLEIFYRCSLMVAWASFIPILSYNRKRSCSYTLDNLVDDLTIWKLIHNQAFFWETVFHAI